MIHTSRLLGRVRLFLAAHKSLNSWHKFGFWLLLTIPFIEIISIYHTIASKIGIIAWVLVWIYIGGFAIQQAIHIIKTSIQRASPFVIVGLGLFVFLIATNIQSIYSINGENTQEIACTLSQLQNSPDWGYRQTCLFGYPTRQFIVPALPSLIFGNSLAMLNIGGAIYFVVGLILFCRGIQIYVEDNKKGDALILLLLGSLLHFYYINHFLFIFEQSIFPLSFALAGSGIWLMYLRTKSHINLIPFTLLIITSIFSYTPSLVLLPLAYGAILWQMSKNQTRQFKLLGLSLVILTAMMILSSFMYRTDIKLGHQYPGGIATALKEIGLATKHIALHIFPRAFTTWGMTPIFIGMLLAPLFGIFGRIPQILALWCLCVFCISVYARGFSYYHIEFRVHRSMVILPVLYALWVHIFNKYRTHMHLAIITIAAFGMTISGLQQYKSQQLARPISQQYKFLQWLVSQKISQHTTLYLLSAQTPKNNFISMRDISQYFTPNLAINNSYVLPTNCAINDLQGIFLLEETNPCNNVIRQQLLQDTTLSYIGTYDGVVGEPLMVFSRKSHP